MTNDKVLLRHFTMLMALSDLSEDDILDLMRQLRTAGTSEILNRVEADREYLQRQGRLLSSSGAHTDRHDTRLELGSDEVKQIERLLVRETGISKAEAAELLTKELKMRHPSAAVPLFIPKDGFARWLRQLTQQFPLSEMLHVASALRNKRVHGVGDDWLEKSDPR